MSFYLMLLFPALRVVALRMSFLFCSLLFFSQITAQPNSVPAEAIRAFDYLNNVRKNPSGFSKETGCDLGGVKTLPALVWNDTLAKVAVAKAMDMAKRNYFAHVSPDGKGINVMIHEAGYTLSPKWIQKKSDNFFESLHAGNEDGATSIKSLIIDKGTPGKGHRKHLLGITDFYEKNTDIGIGYVRDEKSLYKVFMVVIIARHGW